MDSPFVFDKSVTGRHFCGRSAELCELGKALRTGQNRLVAAPRGFGKTSLVLEALDRASREGLIYCRLDLYLAASREDFIRIYCRALLELIRSGREELPAADAADELKGLLPSLAPWIRAPAEAGGAVRIQPPKEYGAGSAERAELFGAAARSAAQRGRRAAVVFDEFQELANCGDPQLELDLRDELQRHHNVAYLFVSGRRNRMEVLVSRLGGGLFQCGHALELPPLEPPRLRAHLRRAFHAGGTDVAESALDEILELSGNRPVYCQMLCYMCWESARERRRIDREDVKRSLTTLLERRAPAFQFLWDGLSLRQRQLLRRLAGRNGARLLSAEFLQEAGMPASSVQRALGALRDRELIVRRGREYRFVDSFLERWIHNPGG